MIFACRNCGKKYRFEPSTCGAHGVEMTCHECGQGHILRNSDNPDEAVIQVGIRGSKAVAAGEEISTITESSARRMTDTSQKRRPMSDGWWVAVNKDRVGPLNEDQLMQMLTEGRIDRETPVWHAPMLQWELMGTIPDTMELLKRVPERPRLLEDTAPRRIRQVDTGSTGERHLRRNTPSGMSSGDLTAGTTREPDEEKQPASNEGAPAWVPAGGLESRDSVAESRREWTEETTKPGKKHDARHSANRQGSETKSTEGRRSGRTLLFVTIAFAVVAVGAVIAVIVLLSQRDAVQTTPKSSPAVSETARTASVPQATPTTPEIDRTAAAAVPAAQSANDAAAPAAGVAAHTSSQTAGSGLPAAAAGNEPSRPWLAPPDGAAPQSGTSPAAQSGVETARAGDSDNTAGADQPHGVVEPRVGATLDQAAVSRFLAEQIGLFQDCRKKMAVDVPRQIPISLKFTISTSGAVKDLGFDTIDIIDADLNQCIKTTFESIKFQPLSREMTYTGNIVLPRVN